ncbi:MAG: hypothetical protein J5625_04595 [Lachnospiraceae bacterium]|nr:hypothetical protein [Lachnospiraceae bacterium]
MIFGEFLSILFKIVFIALIIVSIVAIKKNKDMKKIVVVPLILEALSIFGFAFWDVIENIVYKTDLQSYAIFDLVLGGIFVAGPIFAIAGIIISNKNRSKNINEDYRVLWSIGMIGNLISLVISLLFFALIAFVWFYVVPAIEEWLKNFIDELSKWGGNT